jgi:glycosyltransferase involved in cell wall biosynthesis
VNSLFLAPELFAGEGGITRVLKLYLKALCEIAGEDDSVSFVTLNDSAVNSADLLRYSNRKLSEWRACNRSKLAFCKTTIRLGRRSNRIVCGHVAQLPVAWLASILNPRLSYYLVAHGIEVWRPFTFLETRALRGARCVWCVSEYTRLQVLKYARIAEERTAVLPNALDPFLDPPSPMPTSGGPPVILSITRLTLGDSYKGIDHLIAAMPAVRAEIPSARLRIVGRGDGLPWLQSLARKISTPEAVEFAGYRSDSELLSDYANCSLFALPSQKEGFGLVYLEAMAHGRPCLGARSGGVPEVINGETGVLVEYGDVGGIAAAIVAALRREWRKEAIVERAQMFSYTRFRERLASLISAP